MIEKKCNELRPQYAEKALKKFRCVVFNSIMLEDIPWTLLAILREEKQKQEKENAPSNIFERVENWFSWRQRSRRHCRIVPERDVEIGKSAPYTCVSASPHQELQMATLETVSDIPSTNEETKISENPSNVDTKRSFNGKRALLNFKKKDFTFRKLSSLRKYDILSDNDSSDPKGSGNVPEPSDNLEEISFSQEDLRDSYSDIKSGKRVVSKLQNFKGSVSSVLSRFRPGHSSEGEIPL